MKRALIVSAIALPLPAFLRRLLLVHLCGYKIAPRARIGRSLIGCTTLQMDDDTTIGNLNVIKGMALEMAEGSRIGHLNFISGIPTGKSAKHFHTETDRDPRLKMEPHAGITARHYLDCSNRIQIGPFSSVAGARSQILTHAIDFKAGRQASAPVMIGRYCFIGTGCVVLRGSRLPDYSILAANSSLARAYDQPWTIYSGVPAKPAREIERDSAWFHRQRGYTD